MTTATVNMNWLMLRGLAREKRHYGAFPATFERLMPGHRTFPMDLVGFGALSTQRVPWTLAEIVDELRARFLADRPHNDAPWSIFAISLGGMVALEWAAKHPHDFARVVVANTSAGNMSKVWERFMPAIWPRVPGMLLGDPLQRERTILDVTVNSKSDDDKEAIAHTWHGWFKERTPSRRAFVRQIVAAARSSLPERVETPLLVLTSRADRLVSWKCSQRIAHTLGARLEVHEAAGHDLSLDAPEWICERIAAWSAEA